MRKMIDNWRDAWKFWSLRLHVVATFAAGFLLMTPQMPEEIQNLLPDWLKPIAIAAWLLIGIYVRLVKQGPSQCSQD